MKIRGYLEFTVCYGIRGLLERPADARLQGTPQE